MLSAPLYDVGTVGTMAGRCGTGGTVDGAALGGARFLLPAGIAATRSFSVVYVSQIFSTVYLRRLQGGMVTSWARDTTSVRTYNVFVPADEAAQYVLMTDFDRGVVRVVGSENGTASRTVAVSVANPNSLALLPNGTAVVARHVLTDALVITTSCCVPLLLTFSGVVLDRVNATCTAELIVVTPPATPTITVTVTVTLPATPTITVTVTPPATPTITVTSQVMDLAPAQSSSVLSLVGIFFPVIVVAALLIGLIGLVAYRKYTSRHQVHPVSPSKSTGPSPTEALHTEALHTEALHTEATH